MWSSRLFWKLFAAYAGLILAAAAVSAALIAALEREQVLNYIEDRLHDDAVMLRSQVAYGLGQNHQDGLQALTLRLARETKTRITIVASDGVVLADSEQDPAQMENHLDRQEIALAAASGTGKWTHVSRTLGIPMRYFALRVDEAGRPVGFVRIALPLQTVEARRSTVQRLIWSIAGVVALATLAMTYLVVARIIRPLTNLRSAAQAIADGDYGQRVVVSSHDELGLLSDAFNRMGVELAFRINRMHENQELLATVLAGMIEGVVAVDSKERVLFTNAAAQELLGLVQENLTGRPLWELVRHGTVQQTVRDALRSDQPCRCELEITSPNRRVVSLHARRLPGDPSPGAVLVFHDSTDLRRLESLRRDFMANVSHELKTPLSSIMAYAETLLNGAMNDQDSNVGFVRQIEEQAGKLHQLILDMLSLARIESGQEAFEIERVALAEVVESCIAQCAHAANSKQISLETMPCDRPVHVMADPDGVREILNNLLDNAIKYTPSGGRVALRWREEGTLAVIEVEDTGIGIAAQDQARVFERFYRVDKARSRELGGTGLGLSIVKHLAQAFGGSVAVASDVGRGSTFTVRLPRV